MRIVRAFPYLVSVVTLALLLAGAGGGNVTDAVRATRIELVDRNGQLRGYWSAEDPNGPELRIVAGKLSVKDRDGKLRMTLSASKEGTMLGLADGQGRVPVMLGATAAGPALGLLNEDGKPGVTMAVAEGGSELCLWDRSGNLRVAADVDGDLSRLGLRDGNDKDRVLLSASKEGMGILMNDENGKPRVTLGALRSEMALDMRDGNEKQRLILGVSEHGSGLHVRDDKGERRAAFGVSKNGLGSMSLGWNNKSRTPCVSLMASTDEGQFASDPQLWTVDNVGRESYAPTGALALIFKDYMSGSLGNRVPVGVSYQIPPSTERRTSNLLDEYFRGFLQEMGRKAANPGR